MAAHEYVKVNNPTPNELEKYLQTITRVFDHLYISSLVALKKRHIKNLGITCIINATARDCKKYWMSTPEYDYHQFPMHRGMNFDEVQKYLCQASGIIEREKNAGGKVLVHCKNGRNRSVTLVIGYMVKCCGFSLRDAFLHLRGLRPIIEPKTKNFHQLLIYEKTEKGSGTVSIIRPYQSSGDLKLCLLEYADIVWESIAIGSNLRCAASSPNLLASSYDV